LRVKDVDIAVKSSRNAFDHGPWPRMSGRERGRILHKFADLLEKHKEELAALETLDNGKPLFFSKVADIPLSIDHYRYFAGWADKIHGKSSKNILLKCEKFYSYTYIYFL
jgi:aldehyde dehydrogenase (NAD+)